MRRAPRASRFPGGRSRDLPWRSEAKSWTAALLGLLLSLGCDGGAAPIEDVRTYAPGGGGVRFGAPSAERFGFAEPSVAVEAPPPGIFVPPGWIELPPAPFREVNFVVAGDPRAECYFSTLDGAGGGLAANVNRWRAQLALAPLGETEIAALPREEWLGTEAVFVDFTGTRGDEGADAGAWRLIGLLGIQPERSCFLKMTGPAALVAGEIDAFRRLARSFDGDAGHVHAPGDGHDHSGAQASEAHAPTTADAVASAGQEHASPSGLLWTPPPGWERGPEKPMREITYVVGDAECFVALIPGDGGGLEANIGRWCQQMGQPALGPEEIDGLPRVELLGSPGVFVELARGAAATAPQEHMLGLVLMLDGVSLFVKMIGPRETLDRERSAFLDFCRSARGAG